jgi:cellulose synthase/poly-beta-1,6-N-acetylglucosamine synthase-like glycosyltransferase
VAAVEALLWVSLGLLVWTHVGYPALVWLLARMRPRGVGARAQTPSVALIIAAHNEEAVIERRVLNLLELDYPAELLEIVVASDASTDATDAIVERLARDHGRVRLLRCPRGGKVAAQDLAVRETESELVAFSDANATWAPDTLARLVQPLADESVAYACGRLRLERPDGTNREGAYWRYELWLRAQESAVGSITGGNGSVYAVRRSDYLEIDPRFGHDLSFPYALAQRGRRAVYEAAALAFEKPSRDVEDEFRRKVRMFEHCWLMVLRGGMFRGGGLLYLTQLFSHRLLRYGSGILHVVLLVTSAVLASRATVFAVILGLQVAVLALALAASVGARVPLSRLALYYVLVTWATLVGLVRYLRFGVPAVWEKAEGTR